MARKSLWQLLVWFAIHKLAKIKGPAFVNHDPVDKKVSNAQPLTPSSRRAKKKSSVSIEFRQTINPHSLFDVLDPTALRAFQSIPRSDRQETSA